MAVNNAFWLPNRTRGVDHARKIVWRAGPGKIIGGKSRTKLVNV